MNEPKVGQYGLVHTGSKSGFLIGVGTKSIFDHVVTYIGNGLIVEATPSKGIAIASVTKYSNIAWNTHEPMTDEEGQAIANAVQSFVGQKYLSRAILAAAFKILHLRFLLRLLGNLDEAHASDCSELVVKARRKAGKPVEGTIPDYLISPADLGNRLFYI